MLEILNEYHSQGLIYKQVHPTQPLIIWNYTDMVQYEQKWDEITMMCRGLITDNHGNIVARPFKKFFNIEENRFTPTNDFEVYDKMDGSLIISFLYNDELIVASRASFASDQAIAAKKLLLEKYNTKSGMLSGYTYLFELIAKWNRIVVDYGDDEKLVVLGVIETETGKECDFFEMENEGFDIVRKYHGINDYSVLKTIIKNNEEGFIVKFSNGDRIKIKGEEYIRLHKIITNVSNLSIWECLKDNKPFNELLEKIPDEFYDWVKKTENELNSEYKIIENEYKIIYNKIRKYKNVDDKKIFASHAKEFKYPSILFNMNSNKDYTEFIWKLIRPTYSKAFSLTFNNK